jgi:hypothetical protein
MKSLTPKVLFPLVLVFALSCEKEDTGFELNADYRIKMIVEYQNDQPSCKTIYSYNDNRLDSFRVFRNILNADPSYSNPLSADYTLSIFEYDGNTYTVNGSTVAGGLIISSGQSEYEFEDDLLVRCNNENFKYENGLLVERISSVGSKNKSTYKYEDDHLIRITTSRYSNMEQDYVLNLKYEFEYEGDFVVVDRFVYNEPDQEWILRNRFEYGYSGGLITSREYYEYNNGEVIYHYKTTTEYNEQGDAIRVTETDPEGEVTITEYHYTYVFDEYGAITERTFSSEDYTRKILYYYETGGSNVDDFNVPNSPESFYFTLNEYTNAFKK